MDDGAPALRDWWAKGDTSPAKALQTYYGPQTLHELMERTTWHSGQHVRQYMMLLDKEGISHHRPLPRRTSPSCPCRKTSGTAETHETFGGRRRLQR